MVVNKGLTVQKILQYRRYTGVKPVLVTDYFVVWLLLLNLVRTENEQTQRGTFLKDPF